MPPAMNAALLIGALDVAERQAVLAQFSDLDLSREVARRGGRSGDRPAAGVSSPQQHRALLTYLASYLLPDPAMTARDQLAVMTAFWRVLGFEVPELQDAQVDELSRNLRDRPWLRVVPSPLLLLDGREHMVRAASAAFPAAQFADDPFWTADANWTYGKLLRDPDHSVLDGTEQFALGYKDPNGRTVIGRSLWIERMVQCGQAVVHSDGTPWVFPAVHLGSQDHRDPRRSDQLLDGIDASVVPETYVLLQALWQIAGLPESAWHVDFANEAVYELDRHGRPRSLMSLACIRWYTSSDQIFLGSWYAVYRRNGVGVREAIGTLNRLPLRLIES
jgi:hypothetical protein